MQIPIYRQALHHSWQLVWHNKLLWFFGICAMILGQWGLGDFIGNINLFMEQGSTLFSDWAFLNNILSFFNFDNLTTGFLSFWFFVLLIVFVSAIIFISVVARGALIYAAAEWHQRQRSLPINALWRRGVKNFWSLLFLTFINKILQTVIILGFINSTVFASAATNYWGVMVVAVVFVAAFLAVIVLETVTIYASCFLILEHQLIGQAIVNGWFLFRRHLLVSLEVGLLLLLLSLVLLFFLTGVSIITLIPAAVLWLIAGISGWSILASIGLLVSTMLLLVVIIIAGGIFTVFTISAWVYLFMQMHHTGIFSRVMHYLRSWLHFG